MYRIAFAAIAGILVLPVFALDISEYHFVDVSKKAAADRNYVLSTDDICLSKVVPVALYV